MTLGNAAPFAAIFWISLALMLLVAGFKPHIFSPADGPEPVAAPAE